MPSPLPLVPESAVHEEEAALIADVLLGDRKAVATFVDQYSDTVYAFLRHRIDDESLVQDLCQEVFLAAWSKLGAFEGRSRLKTWLCSIAKNKATDYYRKQIRELPIEDEFGEGALNLPDSNLVDIDEHIDRKIVERQIRTTLAGLPQGYRAVLRWRYWDGYSLQDIARETGRTVKSIERLLARARAEFAGRWGVNRYAKES